MKILIPGKTFLIGEYAVLSGCKALLMATRPYFSFVKVSEGNGTNQLHPKSPAARLLESLSQKSSLHFQEAYGGRGGFGASTAQYLGLAAHHKAEDFQTLLQRPQDLKKFVEEYRQRAWSGQGAQPSGADLIAQISGGLTWTDMSNFGVESFSWPWEEADLFLIPTGHKVATHEHLQNFEARDFSNLRALTEDSYQAWKQLNFLKWVETIRDYSTELQKLSLVAPLSEEFQRKIIGLPGVLAVKGCGALGADVVFALVEKQARNEFLSQLKWPVVYDQSSLGEGLKVEANG